MTAHASIVDSIAALHSQSSYMNTLMLVTVHDNGGSIAIYSEMKYALPPLITVILYVVGFLASWQAVSKHLFDH